MSVEEHGVDNAHGWWRSLTTPLALDTIVTLRTPAEAAEVVLTIRTLDETTPAYASLAVPTGQQRSS
jgi:hypothetical protein